MKPLEIFLVALKTRLGIEHGKYVIKKNILPNEHFKAFKDYNIEVWFVLENYSTCISSSSVRIKGSAEAELLKAEEALLRKTFENILKWYGI